jgi:hypothetical protein
MWSAIVVSHTARDWGAGVSESEGHMPGEPEAGEPAGDQEHPDESERARIAGALDAAASGWLRRGYRVRYRDASLVEVIRQGPPNPTLLALAAVGVGLTLAALVAALRRRRWHLVLLTATPEGRILMRAWWTSRLPNE